MVRRWLVGFALLLLLTTGVAQAQQAFVVGTDYKLVSPAVKTSQPDKVVVTEMFWYGCPHCYRFEPFAESFAANLPPGVVFEQTPSVLNPRWTEHARAYYALKMMNALGQTHKAIFNAIHVERQRLTSLDTLAAFVAEQGLDEKEFRDNYFSFPVETQIRKNVQKEKRFGHRGVPAVIVNGKYLVSGSLAGSNQRMLEIMNFLVAKELAQ
jgi:thiol:disulfide interchange protein DsbA